MSNTSTTRQAAILLSSLPQRQQTQIMSQLPMDQAQILTEAITSLGEIPASEKRQVFQEFQKRNPDSELETRLTRSDSAHDDLLNQLKKNADASWNEAPESYIDFDEVVEADSIFGFLEETTVEQAARALKEEDPQSIAIVLSRLEPSRAARIFLTFDLDWRLAIVRRQAKSTVVSAEVGLSIANRIRKKLNLDSAIEDKKGGLSSLVSMLGCLETTARQTLIDCLTISDLSLARTISRQCLTFDDIAKLPDAEIKGLLQGLDTRLVAAAFSECKPLVMRKLLKNMATSAAKLAEQEIENFKPDQADEVANARQQILDIIFEQKTEAG